VLRQDHPFLALSLHNLGTVRRRQGRAEESRELLERALAIRAAALGEQNIDVAESTAALGAALARLGRPGEALPLLERALASAERALGPDRARTAELARLHGEGLAAASEHAAAEAALARALAASERGLGAEHAQVVRALASLARVRLELGRPADAAADTRRAGEIARSLGMADEAQAALGDLLERATTASAPVDRG
jgi:tetratricopeptide (TPR) repeat protein